MSAGAGYNVQDIAGAANPGTPDQEARNWYQYYFHTERGRKGLEQQRDEICRFLWQTWSPSWAFADATFERSAASFDNTDFVDVVIHSYRHRYGVVPGDPAYADIEARLAEQPAITVPTLVLLGANDDVDPPSTDGKDAVHFKGAYSRHIVAGIGHNVPQEAPTMFADAIRDLHRCDLSGIRDTTTAILPR